MWVQKKERKQLNTGGDRLQEWVCKTKRDQLLNDCSSTEVVTSKKCWKPQLRTYSSKLCWTNWAVSKLRMSKSSTCRWTTTTHSSRLCSAQHVSISLTAWDTFLECIIAIKHLATAEQVWNLASQRLWDSRVMPPKPCHCDCEAVVVQSSPEHYNKKFWVKYTVVKWCKWSEVKWLYFTASPHAHTVCVHMYTLQAQPHIQW